LKEPEQTTPKVEKPSEEANLEPTMADRADQMTDYILSMLVE
jgi:hypothetical protein